MRRYVPSGGVVKIISAKLNKEPFHSLTKKDLKLMFSLLPNQWTEDIKEVVLSAEMFSKSRFGRPVIYSTYLNRLKIISRGFTKAEAAKEVVLELALNGNVSQTEFESHVPRAKLHNIDMLVSFFVTDFIKQLEHNK